MCTLTARSSSAASPCPTAPGTVDLNIAAFAVLGWTPQAFLCASMTLFALATVLGWALYGMRCFEYIWNRALKALSDGLHPRDGSRSHHGFGDDLSVGYSQRPHGCSEPHRPPASERCRRGDYEKALPPYGFKGAENGKGQRERTPASITMKAKSSPVETRNALNNARVSFALRRCVFVV